MKIDQVMIGIADEMANAETIKFLTLNGLKDNGHITDEIYEEFNDSWQIIVIKKSWFKRLFNKLKKENNDLKDGYSYKLVKMYVNTIK